MSKHTPGPWTPQDNATAEDHEMPIYCGDLWIASVFDSGGDRPDGESEANANLIASAPDLLEALQHARGWFLAAGFERRPGGKEALTQYNAAIDKATGGAS